MKDTILIDGVSAEVDWLQVLEQAIVERGIVQVILDISDLLSRQRSNYFHAGAEVYDQIALQQVKRRIERNALNLRSLDLK